MAGSAERTGAADDQGHVQYLAQADRLLAWESNGDGNDNARTHVVLGTPNEYVKDWLENRLYTPIVRTLSGIAGHPVEVGFELCQRAQRNCPSEDGE